jgi:hypothetical protein
MVATETTVRNTASIESRAVSCQIALKMSERSMQVRGYHDVYVDLLQLTGWPERALS